MIEDALNLGNRTRTNLGQDWTLLEHGGPCPWLVVESQRPCAPWSQAFALYRLLQLAYQLMNPTKNLDAQFPEEFKVIATAALNFAFSNPDLAWKLIHLQPQGRECCVVFTLQQRIQAFFSNDKTAPQHQQTPP